MCLYIYALVYIYIYIHIYIYTYIYIHIYIYIEREREREREMHMCVYKCIGIYIGFNMHLRKLMSDFNITSIVYLELLGYSSGFVNFQLQLKMRKVTIIHTFYFKIQQK